MLMNMMLYLKMTLVGDGAVGKTTLLRAYTDPRGYPVSLINENFTMGVEVDKTVVNVSFWDTDGGEEFARLRVLSYPETDVLLLCYSIGSPASLENIITKWHPEVMYHCPGAIFVLVGTKLDLRDDPETIENLASTQMHPVTFEEGLDVAKTVGASFYCECSSLSRKGVACLFNEALRVAKARTVSCYNRPIVNNGVCNVM